MESKYIELKTVSAAIFQSYGHDPKTDYTKLVLLRQLATARAQKMTGLP